MKDESASALLQRVDLPRVRARCGCQRARLQAVGLSIQLAVVVFLSAVATPQIAHANRNRALILYAENRLTSPTVPLGGSLRSSLHHKSGEHVDVFVDFLDTAIFPGKFYEELLVDHLRWIIAIVALLLLVQTALIAVLLLNRRKRRLAETASRMAEDEARELRQELAHTGRVLVMGELSGTLAHELNQPLAAILSNAQAAIHFLNKDPVDIAEVKDILEDIVIDDKRAGYVIERLRALLKKRKTDFQRVDLNGVAEEVLELTRSDLSARGVTISTQFEPALPEISGDRIQLQQVVLNLIRNAAEAMSGNVGREGFIRLATTLDARGFVCLSVSDNGMGLAPGPPERVFEPFFTTKVDGLGIGLPICRSIMKEHGGQIWAANNAGRGATFHLALPTGLVNEASA